MHQRALDHFLIYLVLALSFFCSVFYFSVLVVFTVFMDEIGRSHSHIKWLEVIMFHNRAVNGSGSSRNSDIQTRS